MSIGTPTLYEVASFLEDAVPFFGGRVVPSDSAIATFGSPGGCSVMAGLPSERRTRLVLTERWERNGMTLLQRDGTLIDALARLAPVEKPKGSAVLAYDGKTHRLGYAVRAEDIDVFFDRTHKRRVQELAEELGLPLEYAEAMLGGAA